MNYSDKHVVFVTGSLTGGGAEKVISILASQCAEMGADVDMVILRERKRAFALSDKVKCHQLHSKWKSMQVIDRILQLRRILREKEKCTIIPFLPIITLYVLIANIGLGHRVVTSERADPRRSIFAKGCAMKDRIGSFLMRRLGLYGLCDHMVFQTPDAQACYGRWIRKKSSLIPNPLDTTVLPEPCGAREKWVVAAGRLSEEKNFPMLLRGFAAFYQMYPEYRLTIFGEGKQRAELEALVKELGLDGCVDMPGFVDHLSQRIARAGIYVSTSNHEGISNSMIEALGMGIPAVVTDCPVGGARMFVHTDENGILIPVEDQQAFVNALCRIASDEAYAKRLSQGAAELRKELAAEQICRQWLALV